MADNNTLWKDRKHWLWFPFSFTKYEIRNDRLYRDKGLFKTQSDETLLYRITDIKLVRTFGQKICGTGTVTLCTKVDSDGDIELVNIKNPKQVKDQISEWVENSRKQYNVVGKEFYGAGAHMHGGVDGDHEMGPDGPHPDFAPDDMDGHDIEHDGMI